MCTTDTGIAIVKAKIKVRSVTAACPYRPCAGVAGNIGCVRSFGAFGHEFCTSLLNFRASEILRVMIQWAVKWQRVSSSMDETQLEGKLNELVKEFGGMVDPGYKKLAILTKKASDSHERLKKSVGHLQESLDYLRICIKYQLFDLEATRRENKYLRKLLEEKNS